MFEPRLTSLSLFSRRTILGPDDVASSYSAALGAGRAGPLLGRRRTAADSSCDTQTCSPTCSPVDDGSTDSQLDSPAPGGGGPAAAATRTAAAADGRRAGGTCAEPTRPLRAGMTCTRCGTAGPVAAAVTAGRCAVSLRVSKFVHRSVPRSTNHQQQPVSSGPLLSPCAAASHTVRPVEFFARWAHLRAGGRPRPALPARADGVRETDLRDSRSGGSSRLNQGGRKRTTRPRKRSAERYSTDRNGGIPNTYLR